MSCGVGSPSLIPMQRPVSCLSFSVAPKLGATRRCLAEPRLCLQSCYLQDVGFLVSFVLGLLVYRFLVGWHYNVGVTIFRDDEASLSGDASC